MKQTLLWVKTNELPPQTDYKENIGVSNMLCDVLENKIILGGGANFPTHPLQNGKRIEHKDIYLIRPINNTLKIIDKTTIEKPIADGATVIFNNMLFYIGDNRILKINTINNKLHIFEYYQLPFEIKNCIAHIFDAVIYYGLGSIDGKITNKMFSFNIYTKENTEITPFPASERTQVVSQIFEDEIVVFSGGNSTAYTDGYSFNIKKRTWRKIADVELNEQKISILGAASTKLNSEEMLVIGGFSEKIWNEANHKLTTLTGEKKQQFREFYYTQDFKYYNWNKEMLVYNYKQNRWRSLGKINFNAPCGNSLIKIENNIYSIMGEIRPGQRTPEIHKLTIEKNPS